MSIKRKDLREEVQELCFCSSIGELFALSCEPSTRGAHRLIRKMHCVPNLAQKVFLVLGEKVQNIRGHYICVWEKRFNTRTVQTGQ